MTVEETGLPAQAANANYSEDPLALAEHAFRVARDHCGDCCEYHALWGYLTLSGAINGLNLDRDILQSLLCELSPQDARILIAGAADDRLLAMTVQATRQKKPRITVADRCRTPLLLCRRYADAHNVMATTIEGDLAQRHLTGPFELIFVHYTLWFIPQPRCAFFLRNLGLSLAHRGTLILVHRNLPLKRGSERATPGGDFSARILKMLAARGLPLPEDQAQFRRRLETYAKARRPRSVGAMDLEAVEASLTAAGFHIHERIDHDRRQTIPTPGDDEQPTTMFTRIFVASFES